MWSEIFETQFFRGMKMDLSHLLKRRLFHHFMQQNTSNFINFLLK